MDFGHWFRRGVGLTSPILLASCAGHPAPPPVAPPPASAPFYVDGGAGSEHGNFLSYQDTEHTGPGGAHCITYVWDRPLTGQTALRLRSESCDAPEHPGLYTARELERIVIPMTSSTLFQGAD